MWDSISQRWSEIEPGQRKLIAILGTAFLLTVVTSTIFLRARGTMSMLYSSLPPMETREIANELARQGVDFTVSDDETSISVPSRLEARARMRLAAAGLPNTSPQKGWEIFGDGGLAVTKPQQQAMQIRALQGELARSIASLDTVSKAAVHVSLKQDSPFVQEEEPAKAAVLLHLKPGMALSRDQAAAIAYLVAKSVPDLQTAQISILDEKGTLLFSDNIARGNSSDGDQEVERELQHHVQSQLDMAFGLGKTIVRATIDRDTERTEIRRKSYTPVAGQQTGIPTRETIETEDYTGQGANRTSSGVPGTGANLFGETQAAGGKGSGTYQRSKTDHEFLVNEEEEVRVKPGGATKRMTLGILVDDTLKENVTEIETVARNAAGLDIDRGDTISVEAVKFATSDVKPFEGSGRLEMVRTVARLILNSLALIIGLLTLRSIVTALRPPTPAPAPLPLANPDGDLPLLTDGSEHGHGDSGLALPAGRNSELELPDDLNSLDGSLPMLGSTMTERELASVPIGPSPEELIGQVQTTAVDDIAEVLRHWLEDELDE